MRQFIDPSGLVVVSAGDFSRIGKWGKQGWRLDDEKLAYPALEYSRKKGIENICVHKGLPFPGDLKWWNPMDVTNAKDFPDLNFLVYHSGFKGLEDALPAAEDEFKKTTYIPWVSDICSWKKTNPKVSNIYVEMGSTFAMMVSSSPLLAAYVVGMINDHVTGRKSGRTISLPIWFAWDDGKRYLLPVKGSDTPWYKNVLKNPSIRIDAEGTQSELKVVAVTDATQVKSVIEKLRDKYGANDVKKYYSKLDVAVVAQVR